MAQRCQQRWPDVTPAEERVNCVARGLKTCRKQLEMPCPRRPTARGMRLRRLFFERGNIAYFLAQLLGF
jgi:hypothetical protein